MTMANELTVLAEGPFAPERIDVAWAGPARISVEAQAYVEERWGVYMADAAATGRTLFNAPVVRLVDAAVAGGRLKLVLGPTDYKTFVVTTLRDRAWFEKYAPEAMTPAVGNSVLLTHGDEALLGIRSRKTSAYGGRAHLIGGVLDGLGEGGVGADVGGILAHLRKEMGEETTLGEEMLEGEPTLLAVALDTVLAQPELLWRWEIREEIATVGQRLEAGEHDGYAILHRRQTSPALLEQMTPVAWAAYGRWKNSAR